MLAITGSGDVMTAANLDTSIFEESVAFFLAEPIPEGLRLVDVRAMGPEDFAARTDEHVALADHVRPAVIAWASDAGLTLVEAHTHPGGDPVCLSPTDVSGLAEWVPHVRWRLRGLPYAALVLGPTTIDAVGWSGKGNYPQGVAALHIDGHPPQLMTGLSLPYVKERMN
ncbi:MAG: hypothetical protein WBP81_26980 [Solirubrobacteraceae bacterium]